jgi:hypothetical protein
VKDLDLKSDTDFQGRWKHIQHPNTTE